MGRQRQGRRHMILLHPAKPGSPAIPRHLSQVAPEGTLLHVLDQANMTVEEFRRLL